MPRTCTICNHKNKQEIDEALIENVSYRNIGKRFNINFSAVKRHKDSHLPAKLIKGETIQETIQADSLLEKLKLLSDETLAILKEARSSKDNELVLKAIARAEKQIELQGKLIVEVQNQVVVENTLNVDVKFNAEYFKNLSNEELLKIINS